MNVTVTQGTAGGFLSLYPAGGAIPSTSTINSRAGQTRANSAAVALGSGGTVVMRCGQASGTAHAIVDVNGYFQ